AVLEGLSQLPEADPTVRAAIAAEAEQVGWAGLHAQLRRIDPIAAARIHATDPQRIQRALEVYRLSGRPISHWQALPPGPRLPLRVLKIVLAPQDRAVLDARIAQRLDAMLAQDFLAEVTRLRELPQMRTVAAPLDLPAVRAVGYRQAWEYLDGAGSLAEFRDKAIQATRQLAKRQLTWLRGELDTRWFDPERDRHLVEEAFVGFLAHRTAVQQASGV
ncbi:tRNA dimethylallyltransferase, partial [Xanthomonas vesicatoria]